jgi:phosphatidylinositol-3-phosphatase
LLGNPAAPFQNSLITQGHPNATEVSWASNYQNAGVGIHPSELNYIWSEAGSTLGVTNDDEPYQASGGNNQNSIHLTGLLQQSGIGWKSYQEDIDLAKNEDGELTGTMLPQGDWTVPLHRVDGISAAYTNPYNGSHSYHYAPKHNPPIFFTDTNGGNNTTTSNFQSKHYAPLQQLQLDLKNNTVEKYNWITPNLYNDSHDPLPEGLTYHGVHYTGDKAAIAQGDNFLSILVPQIMASEAYKKNGVIIIWWDETEGGDDSNHALEEIVISPLAKGNAYTNKVKYTHSSDLLTMQRLFNVGRCLADACRATDLADLFRLGAIPQP